DNRHPGLSLDELDELFRQCLGAEKGIWLPHGLAEDTGPRGTDGHSDNVIQFIRPGLVLLQTAPNRSNPNWELAAANRAVLEAEADAAGRALEIIEIPYLPYTSALNGQPHPAPYTNFYPVNHPTVAPRLAAPGHTHP